MSFRSEGAYAPWYQPGDDPEALKRLFDVVYDELHKLAHLQLRRLHARRTLNTTALVHEAYLKLSEQGEPRWESRIHFLNLAAQAMRYVVLDYARRLSASRRGGELTRIPLDETSINVTEHAETLLVLDKALLRLRMMDARSEQVVTLRFFGGLTVKETAAVLGISPATVKRDWQVAKAWLYTELSERDDGR